MTSASRISPPTTTSCGACTPPTARTSSSRTSPSAAPAATPTASISIPAGMSSSMAATSRPATTASPSSPAAAVKPTPSSKPPRMCTSSTAPSPTPSSPASASAAKPPAAFATSALSTASSPTPNLPIYIKSRPGRGAFIEDIVASDLDVAGTRGGFLRFNILNSGIQDQEPVPGDDGIPTIKNFRFSNIRVADCPILVDGTGIHPHKPLEGFSLVNVTGTCAKAISLANIKKAEIRNIKVTGYSGPLLSIDNVTGKGLEGATTIEPLKLPDPAPPPAKPYQLH